MISKVSNSSRLGTVDFSTGTSSSIASTSADLLPYGKFRIVESEAPDGYLTDGAKTIDFTITENGKIVDLTDEAHSIYNQIKRGDIEGVKIGAGTHKRLADVYKRQRCCILSEVCVRFSEIKVLVIGMVIVNHLKHQTVNLVF